MTIGLAVLIFLDLVANNLEPVALAAGSDDFIQDDEGVQKMRENPVIIKMRGSLLNEIRTVSRSSHGKIISLPAAKLQLIFYGEVTIVNARISFSN